MNYRHHPLLSQQSGFFIDDNDQTVYWPHQQGPGYVIDTKTGLELSTDNSVSNFLIALLLAMGFFSYWVGEELAEEFTIFSELGLSAATLFASFLIIWISGYIYSVTVSRPARVNLVRDTLKDHPKVFANRPHAQILKISPYSSTSAFVKDKAILLLFAAIFIGSASYFDLLLGDVLTLLCWGSVLFIIFCYALWKQTTGLTPDEIIEFWPDDIDDTDEDVEVEFDAPEVAPIPKTTIDKITDKVEWLLSGWRFYIIVLPSITFGVIYFASPSKETISADVLYRNYYHAALQPPRPEGKIEIIKKWNTPVIVYVGDSGDLSLNQSIRQELTRTSNVLGIELSFTDNSSETANLKINFVASIEGSLSDDLTTYEFNWWQNNGYFDWLNINVALRPNFPNSTISTSDRRWLLTSLNLHGFGLSGTYSHSNTIYTDHNGTEIDLPKALLTLHYDPRIQPGTRRSEAMSVSKVVAEEYAAAPTIPLTKVQYDHLSAYYDIQTGNLKRGYAGLLSRGSGGDMIAQYFLGNMNAEGKLTSKDEITAVNWYQLSADQNFAPAQNSLGTAHFRGRGTPVDYGKAGIWFLKAAEQEQNFAQGMLCMMYRMGFGVEKDFVRALRWCKTAAQRGNAFAQTHLGVMYRNGEGVEKDLNTAIKWFRYAVDKKYARAQYYLAELYDRGTGVDQNTTTAFQLFQKAAEQHHKKAQLALGKMYRSGRGTERDLKKAIYWFKKSCNKVTC